MVLGNESTENRNRYWHTNKCELKYSQYKTQGNNEPVIVVEDITINPADIQVIGKNNDTFRFSFNGITYIKFKAKDLIEEIKSYSSKLSITAAGKASVNHWGGMSKPQILLDEIEIKESSEFDF